MASACGLIEWCIGALGTIIKTQIIFTIITQC